MRAHPFALAILLAASGVAQRQWNQFRGPDSRGLAADDRPLPAELGEAQRRWRRALPPGHSSPVVWDDRIFLTGFEGKRLETLCVARATGEILWRRSVEADSLERLHRINSPASPTPAADAERVYVYFGSFGLLCYDHDGEEQWRRPMPMARNIFGTAVSPIRAGEHLIFNRDTDGPSFLEAIDPNTGETVWRTERDEFKSGWATPVLWRRDGVDEIVVNGATWLTAYDLTDGSPRWTVPGLTDEPAITPVMANGIVFVTSYNMNTNPEVIGIPQFAELLGEYDTDRSGTLDREEVEPNQSILSRFDADGEGDHPLKAFFRFVDEDRSGELTETEWQKMFRWLGQYRHKNALLAIRPGSEGREPEIVWQHARGIPECPSPLYRDGRVYIVKNGGLVTCLDAATGSVHYDDRLGARGPRYSSPVAGDGKIYAASARGVVTILAAGDELEILSQNDLGERITATPALVDGCVYVRTERALYAFGAAK